MYKCILKACRSNASSKRWFVCVPFLNEVAAKWILCTYQNVAVGNLGKVHTHSSDHHACRLYCSPTLVWYFAVGKKYYWIKGLHRTLLLYQILKQTDAPGFQLCEIQINCIVLCTVQWPTKNGPKIGTCTY